MFPVRSWPSFGIAALLAVVAVIVVVVVVDLVVRLIARRRAWAQLLFRRLRLPFRVFLLVVAVEAAVAATLPFGKAMPVADHVFLILAILSGAWFVGALALYLEDLGLERYRVDVPDNRVARRVRTQVLIIRRLTIVATVVVAVGAVLLTFPAVQLVGTSLLASAGLFSVVAGVAAQSTLGNLFAGMQLAFSDAIRVEDVVVVEQQWGRIEEITLSYVVVHLWDDRRLVLPSSYFTQKPFENWTRRSSELMGAVEFDLDWGVDTAAMRDELARIVAATDLWDKRRAVLQVTEAQAGYVHVRILVTAKDAGHLFDLRCYVREEMIAWLRARNPKALPRMRLHSVDEHPAASRAVPVHAQPEGLFSGSPAAEAHAAQFTGTLPIVSRKVEDAREADEKQAG